VTPFTLGVLSHNNVTVKLTLGVHYPDAYPNVVPDLTLEPVDGDFTEKELEYLVEDLKATVRMLV
jgi:hypothetical protein